MDKSTQITCTCPQVEYNLLCGDWSPHGSPRSVYLKKNNKMANFASCGPIFKIRNSKLVYSKSYNQITDYIFLITSTFRLLLCYFVHFYTQRSRILKNQHCCPTNDMILSNFEKCFNYWMQWHLTMINDSRWYKIQNSSYLIVSCYLFDDSK